ncbi:MAG: hypothetical protein ACXVA9_06345, partial [Bdellovibrionales bacterium]
MVSLLALFPLIATVFVCLAVAFYVMKRKTLAQAICIQQATRMQEDLKAPLEKLLKLNTRAEILRARRHIADTNLQTAQGSGYPPVIAAAKAQQVAVILEQTALRAQQFALLAEAWRIREQNHRDLRGRIAVFPAFQIHTQAFYLRALAVEPKPASDLSPNYETVPMFTEHQRNQFSYQVDLLDKLHGPLGFKLDTVQKIACSVSLEERGDEWKIRILAAKA